MLETFIHSFIQILWASCGFALLFCRGKAASKYLTGAGRAENEGLGRNFFQLTTLINPI